MANSAEYIPFFTESIRRHFPENAEAILMDIEKTDSLIRVDVAFAAISSNPMDRRLQFTAYMLSSIKVLIAREEPFDKIRTICLEVAHAYVQPKNKLHGWLKRLVPKLIQYRIAQWPLKKFAKQIGKLGHPDGFVANLITDKQQTYGLGYGVDIIECGICKLFKKHDLSQYSSLLCEVDEVTSQLAGLKLIRSGTIARGAHQCDFRWMLSQ